MDNVFLVLLLLSLLGLVVGLVHPATVWLGSRSRVALCFGAAVIIFLALFGVTAPPAATPTPEVASSIATSSESPSTPPLIQKQPAAATPAQTSVKATTQTPVSSTPAASTPTVTQTDNQNTSPISNETVSQKNAVRAAQSYLNYTAFSHDGLVAQLEYDQFSQTDATYGADNCGANWNDQAAKAAEQYMSYSAFSRGSLIAQLEYDKFTQAQAEYGADAVGL